MIEISFGGLVNFILGLIFGLILFTITYIYFLVRGKNIDMDAIHKSTQEVDEEALREIIITKQKAFKKRYKAEGYGKVIYDLSMELIESISKHYFPDSKHPMLELSLNEFIMLSHYITNRVDLILEQPLLKNARNIRVTNMVQAYEMKQRIDQQKIMKLVKSKTLQSTMKISLGAINILNPAYWFRKLVVSTSVDFVTQRIGMMIIGVVGEETSKVYSKKLFDKDIEFDLVEKELRALEQGDEYTND